MKSDSKLKAVVGSDAIDGKPIESGGGLLVVAVSRAL